MMRRAVNVAGLLSLVLLLAFSAWSASRSVDAAACERFEQELRSLLALDIRLTAEVMKARTGLVSHYDGIVQTQAARKRAHRALRLVPKGLPAGALNQLLTRGEAGLRRTERLAERFERENAVLRNSLRILPVLARDLGTTQAAEPSATVSALLRDELLLQTWQDEALLRRIDEALTTLSWREQSAPEPERAQLAGIVTHARIIRERTPVVRELTRQITAADDARLTEATMVKFQQVRQAALAVAQRDGNIRFALVLMVLACAALSIILKLRASARALTRTRDELSDALTSLRAEQAKQKELADLKTRFVSMASHEFRTPLCVIMSSTELLEAYGEGWPATKRQKHFDRIRETALSMTRILDAVLMIGRRDAGLLKFEPRPFEVDKLCDDVLEAVGAATGEAARVVCRRQDSGGPAVADATLLRHVLENLLSNALKYSPKDTPVQLDVARESGELIFAVRDHGIGISEDDQRRLFETFHRGKNVGQISGTGLGLAIVHGAVELHGGSVSVQSELNAGSQFTVRIPCPSPG